MIPSGDEWSKVNAVLNEERLRQAFDGVPA
jgi:hypothetical protein